MFNRIVRAGLIVWFTTAGLYSSQTLQPYKPDEHTLFLCHFDKGTDADFARGDPTHKGKGKIVKGFFGGGVYIHEPCGISYKGKGNIDFSQGTIEFYIKPNWDGSSAERVKILGVYGESRYNRISINRLSKKQRPTNRFGAGICSTRGKGTLVDKKTGVRFTGVRVTTDISHWRKGEWHHVAITWGDNGLKLYIDGEKKAEDKNIPPPEGQPEVIMLCGFDAVMDELRISDIERTSFPVFERTTTEAMDLSEAINFQLEKVQEKVKVLDDLLKMAKNKGIKTPYQDITLTVANLFVKFIKADSKDKNLQEIALFEVEHLDEIVTRAIKETKTIIKNPEQQIDVPPSKIENINIRNGEFYSGDTPVFIYGIFTYGDWEEPEKFLPVLRQLGANLIDYPFLPWQVIQGWDKFNEENMNRILSYFDLAKKEGFLVSSLVWPTANIKKKVRWLYQAVPEIAKNFGHNMYMDIDHPLAKKYINAMLSYIASHLKEKENFFCYELIGEANLSGYSKYTLEKYENWLREKYKDIERLNKIWNTTYKNFKQAAVVPKTDENKARWYDWHIFNQYRLTSFFKYQIQVIKKIHPHARFVIFPVNEGLMTTKKRSHSHIQGVDREAYVRMCEISGCDTRPLFANNYWGTCKEEYIMDWLVQSFGFDFMKSVGPDKPIFDPEWHGFCIAGAPSPEIPAEYVRTVFWLAHTHGMGAHIIWWWGRKGTEPKRKYFKYSLLTQPQMLESWARTMLELRRLINYIILFPHLERKVRILYSETSAIHDKTYVDAIDKVYESLYFLDYPVGFITENQIEEGELKNCSLLVIPSARYVRETTVSKIKEYQKKGGKVVMIGEECLKYDEYGRERDNDFLKEVSVFSLSLPVKELEDRLDKIMDEAGINRPIRLLDKDGKNVHGIEMRVAYQGNKKIVYLINLNKYKVKITLRTKKGMKRIRELTQNKLLKVNESFILKPMNPILLEVS